MVRRFTGANRCANTPIHCEIVPTVQVVRCRYQYESLHHYSLLTMHTHTLYTGTCSLSTQLYYAVTRVDMEGLGVECRYKLDILPVYTHTDTLCY